MRNLTVTIRTTPGVPLPETSTPFAAQAGFRLRLIARPSNAEVATPIEMRKVWTFSGLEDGAAYTLIGEAVDADGRVIQTSGPLEIIAPPASAPPTFERVDGLDLAWS